MDLVRQKRLLRQGGSTSTTSLGVSSDGTAKRDSTFSHRLKFPSFGRQRRTAAVVPSSNETINDDRATIRTTITEDSYVDDDDEVVDILRPELEARSNAPGIRGARDQSTSAFLSFLAANPRHGSARPSFPGVTADPTPRINPDGSDKSLSDVLGVLKSLAENLGLSDSSDSDTETDEPSRKKKSKKSTGTKGWSPLHLAAQKGSYDMVKTFIEHGADLEAKQESGWTPLFYAAVQGHVDVCRLLVSEGARIDVLADHGRTPLILAIQSEHMDVFDYLVASGADVEFPGEGIPNQDGTPLSWASLWGHIPFVERLLQLRATVDSRDKQLKTPLALASNKLLPDVVKLLIRHGANVNSVDQRQWTPLHLVSQHEEGPTVEVARLLIEANADLEARNEKNSTPLHLAASWKNIDTARFLVESGADVNAADEKGVTPLFMAVGRSRLDMVNLFLERGALADVYGLTSNALHFAAAQDDLNVLKRVLQTNVNRDLADENDMTPLKIACQNSNAAVAITMVEAGVKP